MKELSTSYLDMRSDTAKEILPKDDHTCCLPHRISSLVCVCVLFEYNYYFKRCAEGICNDLQGKPRSDEKAYFRLLKSIQVHEKPRDRYEISSLINTISMYWSFKLIEMSREIPDRRSSAFWSYPKTNKNAFCSRISSFKQGQKTWPVFWWPRDWDLWAWTTAHPQYQTFCVVSNSVHFCNFS